jgi:8-oxo-dGTP diphosphatase
MIKETAAILLYDRQGKILIKQRTLDAEHNPGCWSFFGGEVEKGESPLQAVKREAKEEMRVILKNPRLFLTSEHKYPEYTDRMHVFIQEFTKDMKVELHEGHAKAWYSIKDALDLNLSPDIRTALDKIARVWPY